PAVTAGSDGSYARDGVVLGHTEHPRGHAVTRSLGAHPSIGRWLRVVSLVATLTASARPVRAQVFELEGGGSSLYQGYGGALNIWGDRFEGNVGAGYLGGFRFSLFLKHLIGHDTLRLGNDAIPVRFATDVFGSSHSIFAQGAGMRRANRRSSFYAFIGASAT